MNKEKTKAILEAAHKDGAARVISDGISTTLAIPFAIIGFVAGSVWLGLRGGFKAGTEILSKNLNNLFEEQL